MTAGKTALRVVIGISMANPHMIMNKNMNMATDTERTLTRT
jgi:hypothetical protein